MRPDSVRPDNVRPASSVPASSPPASLLPTSGLIGVWGVGREGLSVTRYLLGRGFDVVAFDESEKPRPAGLPAAASFTSAARLLDEFSQCTTIVTSPGVARVHPFREILAQRGIRVTSPTAVWMQENAHRVVGVTGTKGKSTTASLIHRILESALVHSELAGNIGIPITDIADPEAIVVAELSSYQCAYLERSPRVAVVTNLFQDHLTWHGSLQQYWLDKAHVFSEGAEVLVCSPATLDTLRSLGVTIPAVVKTTDDPSLAVLDDLTLAEVLSSAHNRENLKLALLAAAEVTNLSISAAAATLADFVGLPHRLQIVSERDGFTWVDDSLATTSESVIAAVNSFDGRELVLIVGGLDRGIDYAPLNAVLNRRTPPVTVICLPANGATMVEPFRASNPDAVTVAETMEQAVLLARQRGSAGSVILLSPGAPSQNAYKDFEQKSEHYVRAITELAPQ